MKGRKNGNIGTREAILLAVLVLAILAVIISVVVKNNKKDNSGVKGNQGNNMTDVEQKYEEGKESIDIKGTENVSIGENGQVTNTSSKVKETKTVAGLKIEGITVSYSNGSTTITGTIKNDTASDINADFVKVIIKDGNGNTFKEIDQYIGKVKANSSKTLDITAQADLSNMQDIQFVK